MMSSPTSSFLNVPITDEERRANRQRSTEYAESLLNSPSRHARDAQFDPRVGRYRSLRRPGEKYDDPTAPYQTYDEARRGLRSIDERLLEAPELTHYSPIDNVPQHKCLPSSVYSSEAYESMRSNAPPPSSSGVQAQNRASFQPEYWQPRWLRRSTLILLGVLMVSCVAGLLVLRWYANSHNGYPVANQNIHYAWTYGPTAVMVFVVALWRQVDYNAKLVQPWQVLRNGPAMPQTSMQLDYVSPLQILSLLSALKRAHFPVVLTIVGFLLSKLVTIAATGLFQVQQHTFMDRFSAFPTQTFDASTTNNPVFNSAPMAASAVYEFYGNLFNGLNYSTGVQANFAYVPLQLASQSAKVPPNATFNATTDTFVPLINCSSVNVTFNGPSTLAPTNITYNSTSKPFGDGNLNFTIHGDTLCQNWPSLISHAIDPLHYIVPPNQIEGTVQSVYCADTSGTIPNDAQPVGILFTLTEIDYTQNLLKNVSRSQGSHLPIALNVSRDVRRIENTLCTPSYTLSQVNFTKDTRLEDPNGITLTNIRNPRNQTLPGFTTADLITTFSTALSAASGLFADARRQSNQTAVVHTGALDLLEAVAQTNQYVTLFDFNTISSAIETTYKGTMSHFANSALSRAVPVNTTGNSTIASVSWDEPRLYLNDDPLFFMVACLGIMAIIALILVFIAPQSVLPRDPGPIATHATILTRSVKLNRLLRRRKRSDMNGITSALSGYEFGTAIASGEDGTSSFKIHVTEGHMLHRASKPVARSSSWRPIAASLPILILTVATSFALIALLAVTQQISTKDRGLFDVPDTSSTTFASRYIPVLFFLFIASTFNGIDFYITLLSPWAAMKKVKATASQSVLTSVVGKFPPTAIRATIKGRYWGALLSTFAALLASLLSIVASDLFLVKDFDMNGPAQSVLRLDTFNLAASYLVDNDHGAAAMLGLIKSNTSFPAFTWNEFAFPNMTLGPTPSDIKSGARLVGPLTGTISALRANLTCNMLENVLQSTADNKVTVNASYDLPPSCVNGLQDPNLTKIDLQTNFTTGNGDFAGRLLDLRFGTNASVFGYVGERNSTLVANSPAVGCPSLAFFWGSLVSQNVNKGPINGAVCYQLIEEVNVNVTFQQNSTQFELSTPPYATNVSTNITLNPNSTSGAKTYDFRIQSNLARQLNIIDGVNSTNGNLDAFFQVLINGTNGVSTATLESSPEAAIASINYQYQQYMAQVFSSLFRQAAPTTNLTDLQTTIAMPRLTQNQPSTIALQVLLGLAAIAVLGGLSLTKTRRLLPVNPCSIAGTMSLLAGSDLCHSYDDATCDCCGKARRKSFPPEEDSGSYVETIHAEHDEHDGEIDDRKQIIPNNTEWMDHIDFDRVFRPHRYTLQNWPEDRKRGIRARYGVDIDPEGEWSLGRRKQSDTFDDFTETSAHPSQSSSRAWLSRDLSTRGRYMRADAGLDAESHEMTTMSGARPTEEGGYG